MEPDLLGRMILSQVVTVLVDISDSHCSDYEDDRLLRCSAVQSVTSCPTFQLYLLPHYQGLSPSVAFRVLPVNYIRGAITNINFKKLTVFRLVVHRVFGTLRFIITHARVHYSSLYADI